MIVVAMAMGHVVATNRIQPHTTANASAVPQPASSHQPEARR